MPTPTPELPLGLAPGQPSHCLPLPDPSFEPFGEGRQLALRHLRQLVNAEGFAAAQRTPFTLHASIHARLSASFSESAWAAWQTSLLDKASRWLRRQGIPVAFAWVRENGPTKGPHLHLLVHLPFPAWGRFKTFLLHAGEFQPFGAGGEAIRISGGAFGTYTQPMRSALLRYLGKSAAPATCAALGIRHHETEPVPLKRCGTSNTIGQLARRKAGWAELHTVEELRAHLHPIAAANDNTNSTKGISDAA